MEIYRRSCNIRREYSHYYRETLLHPFQRRTTVFIYALYDDRQLRVEIFYRGGVEEHIKGQEGKEHHVLFLSGRHYYIIIPLFACVYTCIRGVFTRHAKRKISYFPPRIRIISRARILTVYNIIRSENLRRTLNFPRVPFK